MKNIDMPDFAEGFFSRADFTQSDFNCGFCGQRVGYVKSSFDSWSRVDGDWLTSGCDSDYALEYLAEATEKPLDWQADCDEDAYFACRDSWCDQVKGYTNASTPTWGSPRSEAFKQSKALNVGLKVPWNIAQDARNDDRDHDAFIILLAGMLDFEARCKSKKRWLNTHAGRKWELANPHKLIYNSC
jgi:hypothetical protein